MDIYGRWVFFEFITQRPLVIVEAVPLQQGIIIVAMLCLSENKYVNKEVQTPAFSTLRATTGGIWPVPPR